MDSRLALFIGLVGVAVTAGEIALAAWQRSHGGGGAGHVAAAIVLGLLCTLLFLAWDWSRRVVRRGLLWHHRMLAEPPKARIIAASEIAQPAPELAVMLDELAQSGFRLLGGLERNMAGFTVIAIHLVDAAGTVAAVTLTPLSLPFLARVFGAAVPPWPSCLLLTSLDDGTCVTSTPLSEPWRERPPYNVQNHRAPHDIAALIASHAAVVQKTGRAVIVPASLDDLLDAELQRWRRTVEWRREVGWLTPGEARRLVGGRNPTMVESEARRIERKLGPPVR